ncbi:acetoacetate decarboxylase family protein [Gordonia soli]|uniref:Acetoacetate decarboxylase n=1 Tax=Gordonia soli NBRC 108243 TaxID=1223545 RepID=M0QLT9_9ACTN|nr:acetoacetate decarboxylase family protein [Gordonia soli]GAC68347.1 hypothetical protein GS4_14_01800 [Gordonia soli NBRC 108243]
MWSVAESRSDREEWPVSPEAPWPATVRATLWWHRSTPDAQALLMTDERSIPLTVAMMVDYVDSPVGPYREVLASPALLAPGRRFGPLPRLQVPFIAVDSERSVHGGRSHWSLPKVLAEFTGDVTDRSTAVTEHWSVTAAVRAVPLPLPIAGGIGFAQPISRPDASPQFLCAYARLVGSFRPARVSVAAEGPTLPSWLSPGDHPGIVITSGRMTTGRGTLR